MEGKQTVVFKHTSGADMPVLVIGRPILQNQIRLSKAHKISCLHGINTIFI